MDNLEDFNYDHACHCDECGSTQMGTEYHAHDAMGWATPVHWQCHRCANPPVLVGLWRTAKRKARFHYNRTRYILTTPRAERERRAANMAERRARLEARRAARGV